MSMFYDILYPEFFGDKTSYESLMWLDIFPLIIGIGVIGWQLAFGPIWLPILIGSTKYFPYSKFSYYLNYKFWNGWANVITIWYIIIMDMNATLLAAVLHTFTFPVTMLIFIQEGVNYQKIDFHGK